MQHLVNISIKYLGSRLIYEWKTIKHGIRRQWH